jgi:hypothetical protein
MKATLLISLLLVSVSIAEEKRTAPPPETPRVASRPELPERHRFGNEIIDGGLKWRPAEDAVALSGFYVDLSQDLRRFDVEVKVEKFDRDRFAAEIHVIDHTYQGLITKRSYGAEVMSNDGKSYMSGDPTLFVFSNGGAAGSDWIPGIIHNGVFLKASPVTRIGQAMLLEEYRMVYKEKIRHLEVEMTWWERLGRQRQIVSIEDLDLGNAVFEDRDGGAFGGSTVVTIPLKRGSVLRMDWGMLTDRIDRKWIAEPYRIEGSQEIWFHCQDKGRAGALIEILGGLVDPHEGDAKPKR